MMSKLIKLYELITSGKHDEKIVKGEEAVIKTTSIKMEIYKFNDSITIGVYADGESFRYEFDWSQEDYCFFAKVYWGIERRYREKIKKDGQSFLSQLIVTLR